MFTNLEILKVLKKVKERIEKKDFDLGVDIPWKAWGLCPLVVDTLVLLYENKIPITWKELVISDYIPLFTYENAQNHGATKPNIGIGNDLWWRDNLQNNPTPRLQFINALILEYGGK